MWYERVIATFEGTLLPYQLDRVCNLQKLV